MNVFEDVGAVQTALSPMGFERPRRGKSPFIGRHTSTFTRRTTGPRAIRVCFRSNRRAADVPAERVGCVASAPFLCGKWAAEYRRWNPDGAEGDFDDDFLDDGDSGDKEKKLTRKREDLQKEKII